MKRFMIFPLGLILLVAFSFEAWSSQLIKLNIAQITSKSEDIIRGVCEKIEPGFAGKAIKGAAKVYGMQPKTIATKTYHIRITDVIKSDKYHVGDVAKITTTSHFVGAQGRVIRPSISPTVVCGESEETIVFLPTVKSKWGIRPPVGLHQGVFKVRDGKVRNDFMKFTTFKGLSTKAPGVAKALKVGKVDVSAPPAEMKADDFTAMVKALVAAEGAK